MVPSPKPTEVWVERMMSSSIATSAEVFDEAVGIELDAHSSHLAAQNGQRCTFAVATFDVDRQVALELGKRHEAIDEPERNARPDAPLELGASAARDRRLNVRQRDLDTPRIAEGHVASRPGARLGIGVGESRELQPSHEHRFSAETHASIELAEHVLVDGRLADLLGIGRERRARSEQSIARPRGAQRRTPGRLRR